MSAVFGVGLKEKELFLRLLVRKILHGRGVKSLRREKSEI